MESSIWAEDKNLVGRGNNYEAHRKYFPENSEQLERKVLNAKRKDYAEKRECEKMKEEKGMGSTHGRIESPVL